MFAVVWYNFATKQQASSGRRAKRWPKLIPKILLNIDKNPWKGGQNPSKIWRNGAQECSESDLGSVSWKGRAPVTWIVRHFSATWPILADFWDPSKFGWAPKNGPKNLIRLLFGAPGRSKGGKNRFWKEFGKSVKIWSEIDVEMGGREGGKSLIFHCFSNRIVVSATFEKDRNFDENGRPKGGQNRCQNHRRAIWGGQGGDTCRLRILFGGVLRKAVFWCFLR